MIIWTALPNGFSNAPKRGFGLSVLVSPRLPSGGLGIFADWPDTVKTSALAFRVTVEGCADAPAPFVVQPDAKVLDSKLWKAIFDSSTAEATVTRTDALDAEICSFSSGAIANEVKSYYGLTAQTIMKANEHQLMATSLRHPLLGSLRWHVDPDPQSDVDIMNVPSASPRGVRNYYRLTNDRRSRLREHVVNNLATLKPRPPRRGAGALQDVERQDEILRLAVFHRRIPGPPAGPSLDQNVLDFHRRLAVLLNYAALLRPLGLVFDLVLDLPSDSCLARSGRIRVEPTVNIGIPSCSPSTMFAPAGSSPFRPATGEDICNGMLRLQDKEAFHLETLDVDGAVLKLSGYSDSTERRSLSAAAISPRHAEEEPALGTPPALRSNGVAIVSHDRGEKLADAQQRMRKLEADAPRAVTSS
jgi:hypothetical protein